MNREIRSAHGLTLSRSFIFDRVLDTIPWLCWKPEDIGLKRVHLVAGSWFTSHKKAKAYAAKQGFADADIKSYFDWIGALDGLAGVKREQYLRDTYWPRREQIANSMFDAVVQAYTHELIPVFACLTDTPIGNLEYVEIKTTNEIRRYIGQPDTVLLDEANKNIVLIEIKIGSKSTKYLLDQHIKYIGLSALLNSSDFFPDYRIHNILLASKPEFLANTKGLESMQPESQVGDFVKFNYDTVDVSKFKPYGCDGINALVSTRMNSYPGLQIDSAKDHSGQLSFQFCHWMKFFKMLPDGNAKRSIEPLLGYLVGE